jgi:polysaccharide biosynthesis transport protein
MAVNSLILPQFLAAAPNNVTQGLDLTSVNLGRRQIPILDLGAVSLLLQNGARSRAKRRMMVRASGHDYQDILTGIFPILWRRRRVLYASILATAGAAFLYFSVVGERYESYTLLRVGQGIKDRAGSNSPFGDGIDFTSRMDSLARLGATDYVIRLAAKNVGLERLFDAKHPTLLTQLQNELSKHNFLKKQSESQESGEVSQAAIAGLRSQISARQEGRSDLLKIIFRHPDPEISTEFVNALAYALSATQADLVQVPGADVFFQQQAKRLEHEAEKSAAALKNFSIAASIYSASEQRALLLRRASDLAAMIASTNGSIEDRKGQKQAIVDQLLMLRPVTQSKTVTAIVNRLGGRDDGSTRGNTTTESRLPLPHFEESPPLLLVKVYQDAMANLLKINSELSGSQQLAKALEGELASVNAQLADLTSKEAEYDRLKQIVTRASSAADQYATRFIEEQTSMESVKKAQLSSVRVVQLAEKPLTSAMPRIPHLVALALLGGLALGAAISVLLELAKLRRERPRIDENILQEYVRLRPVNIRAAE